MKTQAWLIRAASWTMVGTLTWLARAQAPAPATGEPTPGTAKPAAPPKPVVDEEGPYAPKGKTGKLREDVQEAPKEEAAAKPEPEAYKPGYAGADAVIGFGEEQQSPTDAYATDITTLSLVLGGEYHVRKDILLRLRLPVTSTSINPTDPRAESYHLTAFGNIEIGGQYEAELGPSTKVPVWLNLAVPTASGDAMAIADPRSMRSYAVNVTSVAARGYEDGELFAPHRFGVVPGAAIRYRSGPMHVGGFLSVPVLVQVGGESPPAAALGQDQIKANAVAVQTLLGGSFFYEIVGKTLDLGLRSWIAGLWKDDYDYPLGPGAPTPSKIQFVLEPELLGKFGPARATLGYIWPIGGRLGGDFKMHGLRLGLGFVF